MLLREGHHRRSVHLAPVVTGHDPTSPRARRGGSAAAGRPDLTQPGVQALLASTEPDLIVSWFWTRRIPAMLVALAPPRGINVHPSLLPRHRGPDPYFWTLYREDAETGVTVHRITDAYDQGPILQRRVPVPPRVNSWTLARASIDPSLEAVRDVVQGIVEGRYADDGTPQNEAFATEAPRPSDDDCEILWDHPASRVIARIRAASPEPGAFTGLGEGTLVVLEAEPYPKPPRGLEPGNVAWLPRAWWWRAATARRCSSPGLVAEDDDTMVTGHRIAARFPRAGEGRRMSLRVSWRWRCWRPLSGVALARRVRARRPRSPTRAPRRRSPRARRSLRRLRSRCWVRGRWPRPAPRRCLPRCGSTAPCGAWWRSRRTTRARRRCAGCAGATGARRWWRGTRCAGCRPGRRCRWCRGWAARRRCGPWALEATRAPGGGRSTWRPPASWAKRREATALEVAASEWALTAMGRRSREGVDEPAPTVTRASVALRVEPRRASPVALLGRWS
ncbi:MAG: hypothetical protein IPF99_41015 [Deltaproteobacteria bacterium]|nr:hypothetical protein [Deltaproteobacteria bacterium]